MFNTVNVIENGRREKKLNIKFFNTLKIPFSELWETYILGALSLHISFNKTQSYLLNPEAT